MFLMSWPPLFFVPSGFNSKKCVMFDARLRSLASERLGNTVHVCRWEEEDLPAWHAARSSPPFPRPATSTKGGYVGWTATGKRRGPGLRSNRRRGDIPTVLISGTPVRGGADYPNQWRVYRDGMKLSSHLHFKPSIGYCCVWSSAAGVRTVSTGHDLRRTSAQCFLSFLFFLSYSLTCRNFPC